MEDVVIPNFVDDSDVFELITLLESDEDIHGAFVKAADDVTSKRGDTRQTCETCGASYQTVAGIRRHTNMKHKQLTLTETDIKFVLYRSCREIADDQCYGQDINCKFANYYAEECFDQEHFISKVLFKRVDALCAKLHDNKNKDSFFSDFYGEIALNSKLFFPKMENAEASLLAINICPKLINEVEHKSRQPAPSNKPGTTTLTERDLSSIEYLGGYVIRKLYYQYDKGKDEANELVCSILEACRSEEINDQQLISSLSRGGLWGITDLTRSLFVKAEEKFRAETWNESRLRCIRTDQMVNALMQNLDVIALFSSVLEDCSLYSDGFEESSRNILEKMLILYLRVRAFSLTKDIIVRFKQKSIRGKQNKSTGTSVKADGKKKALRKELKRANNEG